MARKPDRELEQYRNLLTAPTRFEDGFGWSTIAGMLFCGLVMMPGSIYLSLMTGGSMGAVGTWVTVILFSEITRRAMKTMSKGNLIVLLAVANVMCLGGPFGQFVMRAYTLTSETVRDLGMQDHFPAWYCPAADSPAITERNLFHPDWFKPMAIVVMAAVIALVNKFTIGYAFFRLCSDVEQLPFPMAPINAQGSLAIAESLEKEEEGAPKKPEIDQDGHRIYSRWRIFSLGAMIGVCFGMLQVGVPAVTGMLLDKPVYLIPQPYLDTTTMTEGLLPAVPTGLVIDPGIVLTGMVLPFWAIMGSFAAIAATFLINPLLRAGGVLAQWQPGMNTVNTTFVNSVDFWMSFGFGAAAAIAAVSVFSTARDVLRKSRARRARLALHAGSSAQDARAAQLGSLWRTPNLGRGDYPVWLAVAIYAVASVAMVLLCNALVKGILPFLIVFCFLYNPFISYINARLMGLTGQAVAIPFVREGAFILSGSQSLDIWLAPIPIENYGAFSQTFRVNELTGVRFTSLMKAEALALPCLCLFSFLFWAFIWKASPIPSEMFPAAQLNWDLMVKSNTLLWSSTFHPDVVGGAADVVRGFSDTEFAKAVHPVAMLAGGGVTVGLFALFALLGLPTLFVYGVVRGLGALPHTMVLEIVGALVGRYYFQRKFGSSNFLRMGPTIMAGYFTGAGLISMVAIAMNLIRSAVSSAPF
ncbi:MAG: peptide transporter [Kiritimatiellae bacterium]|jgi:hypothetical protein|nr:peptide transporter [Kiritimatiellia bacterium]